MGLFDNIPGLGASTNGSGAGPASNGTVGSSDASAEDAALGADAEAADRPDIAAPDAEAEPDPEAEQAMRTRKQARRITGVRYTFDTKDEPDAERPFAHGYVDGAESVEKTPFERFVRIQREVERINEELDRLEAREQELKSTRSERIALEADAERDRVRLEACERDAAEAEEAYNEAAVTHASAQQTARQTEAASDVPNDTPAPDESTPPRRGSFLYGLLYTLAGFVFVVGEVIMSREVVANGLRLQGQVEPWLFAIGIALLAVLLKPAYDRMVEKPYWNGNKRPFQVVIGIAVVLTVATLFVLGAFRTQAYSIQQQQEQLNSQIQTLQDAGAPPSEIEPLQQEYEALGMERFNSTWGLLSFILTGLLFAIAGAISLGIGLNHLRTWSFRRYQRVRDWRGQGIGWFKMYRGKREVERLRAMQQELREKRDGQRVQLRGREKKLSHMPAMDTLNDQLRRITKRQEELRAARSEALSNQGVEAYASGYDLAQQSGAVFKASPKPPRNGAASRPSNTQASSAGDSARAASASTSSENATDTTYRRPFLRVRDEIAKDTFNRS